MSATFAPQLELPSTRSEQITVTETTPSHVASPTVSWLPHSITLSPDAHLEEHRREPMFGNHIREAVSIFKDWLGE